MRNFFSNYQVHEIGDPSSFVHNFDVSVIMPFYKKLKEFKLILPRNQTYLQRNGIEVIISMDEDSEKDQLLHFIAQYPFINWRIIVNHEKHSWRNPAKAINVGIRYATKKYILVCSPESEFDSDLIYLLRKAMFYYPNHFAIGSVQFKNFDREDLSMLPVPYGSIMTKKSDLLELRGYDENLYEWGGDDDNIRARLEMIGIKKIAIPEALVVHWESEYELKSRSKKHLAQNRPVNITKEILYPNTHIVNGKNWGADFDTIVYDWKNKKNIRTNLTTYLENFIKFDISSDNIFNRYEKIVLVQSYNEIEFVDKFLSDSATHFDAIIMLDDESDDGTYEKATHEKLILKVQKKRNKFNDLENRNLLLKIVSFFNTEWITFLDMDESLDTRFLDFSFTHNSQMQVAAFHLIHLWNDKNFFNGEYPFTHNGIQLRYRMFRNIGHCQILTLKKSLHFHLTPYIGNVVVAKILILHYGHLLEKRRQEKVLFYLDEDRDNDQNSYSHLLNSDPTLIKVKDLKLSDLNVQL